MGEEAWQTQNAQYFAVDSGFRDCDREYSDDGLVSTASVIDYFATICIRMLPALGTAKFSAFLSRLKGFSYDFTHHFRLYRNVCTNRALSIQV